MVRLERTHLCFLNAPLHTALEVTARRKAAKGLRAHIPWASFDLVRLSNALVRWTLHAFALPRHAALLIGATLLWRARYVRVVLLDQRARIRRTPRETTARLPSFVAEAAVPFPDNLFPATQHGQRLPVHVGE